MPIIVGITRRLDDRNGGDTEGPTAVSLHQMRARALHRVFDPHDVIQVVDWGLTDDREPHEFVELVAAAHEFIQLSYPAVPGLTWIGERLIEAAAGEALTEVVKAVIARLRPEQEAKAVLDIEITLPDGTHIRVDPPDRFSNIVIRFHDGKIDELQYGN